VYVATRRLYIATRLQCVAIRRQPGRSKRRCAGDRQRGVDRDRHSCSASRRVLLGNHNYPPTDAPVGPDNRLALPDVAFDSTVRFVHNHLCAGFRGQYCVFATHSPVQAVQLGVHTARACLPAGPRRRPLTASWWGPTVSVSGRTDGGGSGGCGCSRRRCWC